MLKKIIVITGIIFSTNAFSQAEKFAGASLALNTGLNKEFLNRDTKRFSSKDNTAGNINASYTFAVSPSITLGVGLNYDFSSSTVFPSSETESEDTDFLLKNHYSVNIEPGYAFNESTLGYFKLAYHNAKANYSYVSLDQSITGTGYGFGAKYLLSENLFLNFEFQTIKYNSYSAYIYTVENKTQLTTIGIGYKF